MKKLQGILPGLPAPPSAQLLCCEAQHHPPFLTLPSGSTRGSSGGLYSFQMFITLQVTGDAWEGKG